MLLMNEIVERLHLLNTKNLADYYDVSTKDGQEALKDAKLDRDLIEPLAGLLKRKECQRLFLTQKLMGILNYLSVEDVKKAWPFFRYTHELLWIEGPPFNYKEVSFLVGYIIDARNPEGGVFVDRIVYNTQTKVFGCVRVLLPKNGEDFASFLNRVKVDTPHIKSYQPRLADIDADVLALDVVIQVVRLLVFINTPKHIKTSDEQDFISLNKKRIRNGKEPLVSYRIVDLSEEVKQKMRASGHDPDNPGVAFHWRRGHFKFLSHARKPGLYWWSPHTAGSKQNGTVHKAYVYGKNNEESQTASV